MQEHGKARNRKVQGAKRELSTAGQETASMTAKEKASNAVRNKHDESKSNT